MNLFRDPRWGRGQEVPGEDPVLTSEYVKHFSQGLQHGDVNNVDVDPEHLQIISTCKHFAGYDIETGRSGNNVNISARMLAEYYMPVFQTCVQVAKVKSMMVFLTVPRPLSLAFSLCRTAPVCACTHDWHCR
jgi:beta-D-xylosidase 4